jgi:two-component system chemotaxis response regulator CheY
VKKILVIDDSETIRQQVRQALAATGYEIIEAVDGIDGLEKLRALTDLDIALCDVNMPRMNGLDMIAEVQRSAPRSDPDADHRGTAVADPTRPRGRGQGLDRQALQARAAGRGRDEADRSASQAASS